MSRFPTANHLTSWARICPGNDQSGGRRLNASIGKGNNWLKSALIEAAWAASRCKDSYYKALFHRLKARRGPKRAIVAVAHSMLAAIWHMLTRKANTETSASRTSTRSIKNASAATISNASLS